MPPITDPISPQARVPSKSCFFFKVYSLAAFANFLGLAQTTGHQNLTLMMRKRD
jgi:hypothetical protein